MSGEVSNTCSALCVVKAAGPSFFLEGTLNGGRSTVTARFSLEVCALRARQDPPLPSVGCGQRPTGRQWKRPRPCDSGGWDVCYSARSDTQRQVWAGSGAKPRRSLQHDALDWHAAGPSPQRPAKPQHHGPLQGSRRQEITLIEIIWRRYGLPGILAASHSDSLLPCHSRCRAPYPCCVGTGGEHSSSWWSRR